MEDKLISSISLTINNVKEIAHHVELKTLVLSKYIAMKIMCFFISIKHRHIKH